MKHISFCQLQTTGYQSGASSSKRAASYRPIYTHAYSNCPAYAMNIVLLYYCTNNRYQTTALSTPFNAASHMHQDRRTYSHARSKFSVQPTV